jgi:hypothetical protein
MKTITFLISLFLFQIVGAETFKSHSVVMSVRDSADIKTKTIFWWSDWSTILPADGSHRNIFVKKNKIILERGDVYTLNKIVKRKIGQFRHELSTVFIYNATDQDGKKWTVSVCRTKHIYAIQIENSKIMVVYQ